MEGFAKKYDLAGISLRHLEVFSAVVREGSYSNAALDLQMSRTNVKRICDEFTEIAGRELFTGRGGECCDLAPSLFGQGVYSRLGPLATSLRKLEEGVLERFRKAGAKGGGTVNGEMVDSLAKGSVVFTADVISPLGSAGGEWPGYQFNAMMRRRHPYADLKETLCAGAGKGADGC